MHKLYALITATSMGVRITPVNQQPVGIGNLYMMTSTSAESNVLNISASLGLKTLVLTRFVKDSPIAAFIKGDLRRRNIAYEGPEIEPDGPWGVRHQFNIADTGYGMRGPRVYNDRAGEVGRGIQRRILTWSASFAARAWRSSTSRGCLPPCRRRRATPA